MQGLTFCRLMNYFFICNETIYPVFISCLLYARLNTIAETTICLITYNSCAKYNVFYINRLCWF